jgi:hypothetical protein
MPEVPTTQSLERLYHRVAELEADIRLIQSTIEALERVVLSGQPRERTIARHDYHDLNHPAWED